MRVIWDLKSLIQRLREDQRLRIRVVILISVGILSLVPMLFAPFLIKSPPTSRSEEIQAALEDIHRSKLVFNPSREMEQGKVERVEARISYHDIGDAITTNLKGRGKPELEEIEVGERMTVTLHADKDEFEIVKYSSDEQLLVGRAYSQWEWDVKPESHGDLYLHLKAVINLSRRGVDEAPYDIPVIDRPIKVKVNPAYIAAQAARDKDIRNLIVGLIIGGGSVFGLITGMIAWIRRRKRKARELAGRSWEKVSESREE